MTERRLARLCQGKEEVRMKPVTTEEFYQEVVARIRADERPSTSYIQRTFHIGYNQAADIMIRMEREGIVSKPNHIGKREILKP